MPGTLYVTATPIGNLEDLTARAAEMLRQVSVIACEDTRVSQTLKKLTGSKARLISYHKFNEQKSVARLLDILRSGVSVALVSDAGTPCISDPGHILVTACHEAGVPVTPLPGPSVVTSACSVSGFDCSRFLFLGFLARTPSALETEFQQIIPWPHPVVFFESPGRLRSTLDFLSNRLPKSRRLCLCKEISKVFETVIHGNLEAVRQRLEDLPAKGEWTVVLESLEGWKEATATPGKSLDEVAAFFQIKRSQAAKVLKILSGRDRRSLYRGD